MVAGSWRAAAPVYSDADWREFCRRLDAGIEVRSLLRKHVSRRQRSASRRPGRGPQPDADRDYVRHAACELSIPLALPLALTEQESGFRNEVLGRFGELGAAQILSATAREHGFDFRRLQDGYRHDVRAGLTVLHTLLDRLGDKAGALGGYNGEPNCPSSPPAILAFVDRYAAAVQGRKGRHTDVACN